MAIFDKNKKQYSGVFSTGAMGAIAPVILRKRLIAPVILHLPYLVIKQNEVPTLKRRLHETF